MNLFLVVFLPSLLLVVLGAVSWRWRRLASCETRVILTGGGTGGHVNPALAIAESIKKREPHTCFLYVGVRNKAEAVIVKRAGYPLVFVSSEGFPGFRPSFRLLRFLFRLTVGLAKSIWIVLVFAPRWVIATGGYVSAPIILATLLLRFLRLSPTKILVHEQNSVPGELNRFIGKWADRVLLTFPQTLSSFSRNGVVVGYPLRHSIQLKPREEALANLDMKISPKRKVVFVFGGSQGSRSINRGIVDALRFLLPHRDKLFIIHGMGLGSSQEYDAVADTEQRVQSAFSTEEMEQVKEFYYRQDYFHNIADVYSVSELIVCRSGAGSLNEISRLQKPVLLIPKANLPGDHQVMNARAMKYAGAAEILFEDTALEEGQVLEKVEGQVLADRILRLLQDPDRLAEMGSRSGNFLRKNAIARIQSELYGDETYNNGLGFSTVPLRPLLSNQTLFRVLENARQRYQENYNPLRVIGDHDDLIYYQHRAAALLTHANWQDRNLGVKLVGLTFYLEKIPALLHMLLDRTPARRLKRLCGGDYEQVGFIRRNALQALQLMNHFDVVIEKSLLMAMEDPYFEVRSQACRATAKFSSYLAGKDTWLKVLLQRLADESFEVVVEAVKALGEVGVDGRALSALLGLQEHFHWQVRDAALQGIRRLLERRVICPSQELLDSVSHFILTATDFRPHFSIKETYRGIEQYCHQRMIDDSQQLGLTVGSSSMAGKH